MENLDKTEEQLVDELAELRRRNAELEKAGGQVRLLSQIVEQMKDAVILTSQDQIYYVNNTFCDMYGYTKDEVIGQLAIILFAGGEEEYRALEKQFDSAFKHGISVIEYQDKRKDGSVFWVSNTVGAVHIEDTNELYCVSVIRDITERRRTEEMLQEQDERYRNVIAQADGVAYEDDWLNRTYTFMSEGIERLTGYTSDEITPDLLASLFEENIQYVSSGMAARSEVSRRVGGEASTLYRADYRLRTRDGRTVWVADFAVQRRDPSGKLVGSLGMLQDITDRKQAAEALKESEERYRLIFENVNDGISIYESFPDGSRKLIDCNSHYAEMSGYSREELMEMDETIEVRVGHDTPEQLAAMMERKSARQPYSGIFSWIRPDGRENYVEFTANFLNIDGRDFIVGIDYDITERRQAADKLRESERRNQALLEAVPDLIFRLNGDGVFLDFVPSKDMLTYVPPDQFLGKRVDEVFPTEEAQQAMNYMKQVLQTGDTQVFEYQLSSRSEGDQVREYEARYVASGQDEVLAIVRDITERKRMEEELLKVEKLESIGVLAGGIAHDLNNLLTAIVGNISLARMHQNPADKDRRLVEAEAASMRVKDLTQQLLTFSKGGAPVLQTATIGNLLRDSATFALRGSNVRCEFSIPDDLWPVEMDEGQMNQVINNLVINADQAMPGGGTIRICAENINIDAESGLPLEPGAYVTVSIEDQGVGISQEHVQKIFDPFFTTKQAGSGLGLATSYSIIQKHNGHTTVESEIEVGTTFRIYLPASTETVLTEQEAIEEMPIIGEGKILVMDDEKHIRDLAVGMLSSLGYKVVVAIDGVEAVQMYEKSMKSGNPFDAVILDLTVPGGMGGREAIERLMEIDTEVKAIVSSGYSNDPVMAGFGEHGFRGVIAKPYRIMELSQVLHEALSSTAL